LHVGACLGRCRQALANVSTAGVSGCPCPACASCSRHGSCRGGRRCWTAARPTRPLLQPHPPSPGAVSGWWRGQSCGQLTARTGEWGEGCRRMGWCCPSRTPLPGQLQARMCGSSCPDPHPQTRSALEGPRPKSGRPCVGGTGGRGLRRVASCEDLASCEDVSCVEARVPRQHNQKGMSVKSVRSVKSAWGLLVSTWSGGNSTGPQPLPVRGNSAGPLVSTWSGVTAQGLGLYLTRPVVLGKLGFDLKHQSVTC